MSESRRRGDQSAMEKKIEHGDAGAIMRAVRAGCRSRHDKLRAGASHGARKDENVRTESRVLVYCSMETISSPVSSLFDLGAILGGVVVRRGYGRVVVRVGAWSWRKVRAVFQGGRGQARPL